MYGSCSQKVDDDYMGMKSGCILSLGGTAFMWWLSFHTIRLAKLTWLQSVCSWMGAHLSSKANAKARVLLQTMPPMQDGGTTALVFVLEA